MTLKYIYAKMPISVALSSGLRKMFRPRDVCNKVILGFCLFFYIYLYLSIETFTVLISVILNHSQSQHKWLQKVSSCKREVTTNIYIRLVMHFKLRRKCYKLYCMAHNRHITLNM